jgi:hypothetical protein
MSICYDEDNDQLQYAWSIDGEPKSTERDYSTKLTTGEHAVQLNVSDGIAQDNVQQTITVEPDQIYPATNLMVPLKGVCYSPGFRLAGTSPLPEDQMDEELDTISNELGCNAVRIYGDYDDSLLNCAQIAVKKAFDCIALAPRYIDSTIDETITKVADFAREAQNLSELTGKVQLWVGNELTIDTRGIREGATYFERCVAQDPPNMSNVLNEFLRNLTSVSRKEFEGKLSYSAGSWEPVEWNRIGVDIVGSNEYFWPGGDLEAKIVSLKNLGKPVYVTEFGSCTFKGACQWGGAGVLHDDNTLYDEDEQAKCIERYLRIFNRAKPNGCFLWEYKANNARHFGIVTPGAEVSRKKSVYMYKSYQRAA